MTTPAFVVGLLVASVGVVSVVLVAVAVSMRKGWDAMAGRPTSSTNTPATPDAPDSREASPQP